MWKKLLSKLSNWLSEPWITCEIVVGDEEEKCQGCCGCKCKDNSESKHE